MCPAGTQGRGVWLAGLAIRLDAGCCKEGTEGCGEAAGRLEVGAKFTEGLWAGGDAGRGPSSHERRCGADWR